MGSALSFSPLSIPHLILVIGLLALMAIVLFTRGDPVVRLSVLLVALFALPYAIGSAVMISAVDPVFAHPFARGLVAGTGLLGPALLFMLLAISGKLELYRWVLVVASVVAIAGAVLTFATDLVIEPELQWTDGGFYFHRAKPLDVLVIGQFVVWAMVGVVLARGGNTAHRSDRQQRVGRRLVLIGVLAIIAASDALLANGYGVYPFGVVPGAVAVFLALKAVREDDFLRARGFDTATAVELAVVVGALGALAGVLALLHWQDAATPTAIAVIAVPVLGLAHVGMMMARRRFGELAAVEEGADQGLEEFVDLAGRVRDEPELLAPLRALFEAHAGISEVQLMTVGPGGALTLVETASEEAESPGVVVDARVRAWLLSNPGPLVQEELATMRLGGLRGPIESFMRSLRAELVVPLVDREALVGVVVCTPRSGRAVRASQADLVAQAAVACAKSLTYAALFREAEARIEVAKEVEVAAAVRQARTAGELIVRYGDAEVAGYYQPATQFGGHWWASYELAGGRFAVVMGDVSGSGVSAALVSFTAEGACETARLMLADDLDVVALLELLDASVRHVGGEAHSMSCFAAVFDPAGSVTFANAGHQFPYVCRANPGSAETELRSLIARGTPLGSDPLRLEARTFELRADDIVVLYSDSLVEARAAGRSFGDRRLQRTLRARARGTGERALHAILADARAHWGEADLEDDLNVVVVRLGADGVAAHG
ncbi:MAG TPA: PP2C family protein-serine/threonine phosphatase [Kofleriaceae bacterium]|nr:PP2C family protein-serine/threonine phosphatase [Kofleriaceae bacterium]